MQRVEEEIIDVKVKCDWPGEKSHLLSPPAGAARGSTLHVQVSGWAQWS